MTLTAQSPLNPISAVPSLIQRTQVRVAVFPFSTLMSLKMISLFRVTSKGPMFLLMADDRKVIRYKPGRRLSVTKVFFTEELTAE